MKTGSKLRLLPLFLAFFALYALTAQRGACWQDSGVFQWRIHYLDLVGVAGLSSAHPLYIRAGWIFSRIVSGFTAIGRETAVSLMSAFWSALALCAVAASAFRLTRSRTIAIAVATTLGCAHMTWWLSTIAESYTFSMCMLAFETLCVIHALTSEYPRKAIAGAMFFSGAGFAVHNLSLLSLPATACAIIHAISKERRHADPSPARTANMFITVAIAIASWCVGALPVLKLVAGEIAEGTPVAVAIRDMLFGNYGDEVLGRSAISPRITAANLALAAMSFASPCLIVAAFSLRNRLKHLNWRKITPEMLYVAVLLVFHLGFFVRYRIADQALFVLPTLLFATLLLSRLLVGRRDLKLLVVATVACAILVPLAANAILHAPVLKQRVMAAKSRQLPYRDEIRYWILPWKHNEDSAERFAREAIKRMDATGGSLYADSTSAPPLMLRLDNRERDWRLFTPWNDFSAFCAEAKAGHRVLAVTTIRGYCPDEALATDNVKGLFE